MSFIHPNIYPITKWLPKSRVDHISDILSWEFVYFLINNWKWLANTIEIVTECKHILDRQTFVLRNMQVLHILAVDSFSLSTAEISHMPDCHRVVITQVDTAVMSEEFINFNLVSVLGLELLCFNLNFLISEWTNLVVHIDFVIDVF